MDNITHGVIGSSIFSYITGKYDNKNFLWGFLIGNAPDMDVFLGSLLTDNPIDKFFFHRGITHSFLGIFIFSVVMTIFTKRLYQDISWLRLFIAYFVSILVGHLIVDGFTSYGIRPLLPFSDQAFSSDNIFIIDLVLLFGLIILTVLRLIKLNKKKLTHIILLFSFGYFALSFGIKSYITNIFANSADTLPANIYISDILTTPEPLQILLWRGVIPSQDGYYEGYYSIFDKDKNINRKYYPKYLSLAMGAKGEKIGSNISFGQDNLNISQPTIQKYIGFNRGYNTFIYLGGDKYKMETMTFGKVNGWINKFDRMFSLNISTNSNQSGYIYDLKQGPGENTNPITKIDLNMFVGRIFGIKE